MAMNRFSSLTPSRFNPLSLEEVMLVPSIKRKEHDSILAAQNAITDKLATVDPLDVHAIEAMKLREDMNNKLTAQAEALTKEGVSPAMKNQFLALNREYQNLTGPMGKIGQINKSKQLYDAEKARFLETASKQYGSNRAIELWNEKTANYTGYDTENKIRHIDPQGIVAAQDFQSDLKDFNSLLGSTIREVASGGGSVIYDPELGGYKTTNFNSSQSTKNNIAQLNEMRKVLQAKWIDDGGEGTLYNREAGIDINNFNNRFNSAINMQAEKATSNKSDNSVSFNSDGSRKSPEDTSYPTGIFDPSSVRSVGGTVDSINFNRIGSSEGTGFGQSNNVNSKGVKGKIVSYKDVIKDPILQRAYEKAYNEVIESVKENSHLDINSKEAANIISRHMRTNMKIPTVGNDVIQADITPNSQMFMGQLQGKDANKRNETIQKNLEAGFRTIIDPETGKELTPKEFREKGYTVEYIGYDSPLNYRGYKFGENNKEQQVMAHKVIVYDEDKKPIGNAAVSRTKQELETPEFKKAYIIHHVYQNAAQKYGDWITPNKYIKNTKVKMNEDSTFSIEYNGKTHDGLNAAEYQKALDYIITNQ